MDCYSHDFTNSEQAHATQYKALIFRQNVFYFYDGIQEMTALITIDVILTRFYVKLTVSSLAGFLVMY